MSRLPVPTDHPPPRVVSHRRRQFSLRSLFGWIVCVAVICTAFTSLPVPLAIGFTLLFLALWGFAAILPEVLTWALLGGVTALLTGIGAAWVLRDLSQQFAFVAADVVLLCALVYGARKQIWILPWLIAGQVIGRALVTAMVRGELPMESRIAVLIGLVSCEFLGVIVVAYLGWCVNQEN